MIYAILRQRMTKEPVLAGVVILEGQQIRVTANSKLLMRLLEEIFAYPTKVKERTEGGVFKRTPKTARENIKVSLMQNLYYPYNIGALKDTVESSKILKYKKVFPTNILYGEVRHEQPTRSAS